MYISYSGFCFAFRSLDSLKGAKLWENIKLRRVNGVEYCFACEFMSAKRKLSTRKNQRKTEHTLPY